MPDIDGKYTLTEIAKELNVVPTFINRIQRETDIGGPIGTKGKAAAFNRGYVKIFRIVRALRMFGLSFEDIKKLWHLEEMLLVEYRRVRKADSSRFPTTNDEPDFRTAKLVIHPDSIPHPDVMGQESTRRSATKNYQELFTMLSEYKREIGKSRKSFAGELAKIEVDLDSILAE